MSAVRGAELGHSPVVAIGGAVLPDDVARNLESVVVDLAVGLPAGATLRLRDPDLRALAEARLTVGGRRGGLAEQPGRPARRRTLRRRGDGAGVRVRRARLGGDRPLPRPAAPAHPRTPHPLLDPDRRRRRGPRPAPARRAGPGHDRGRRAPARARRAVRRQRLGVPEARARAAGRVVLLSEGKVHVRARPTVATGQPVPLVVGENLERLRVRVTSAGQVGEVEAEGWDQATQRPVSGRQPTQGTSAQAGVGHPRLKAAFPAPTMHVGSPVLATQAEAQAHARGLALRLSDTHAELEGLCGGDPRLVPGVPVRVGGTGPAHDGTYVLTRVQHVSDRDGYKTRVECGGAEDRTLRGLLGGGADTPTGSGNRPVQGVTVGVVTDVKDPTRTGRVKVRFPWLSRELRHRLGPRRRTGRGHRAWAGLAARGQRRGARRVRPRRHPYALRARGAVERRAAPPLAATLVDGTGRTRRAGTAQPYRSATGAVRRDRQVRRSPWPPGTTP